MYLGHGGRLSREQVAVPDRAPRMVWLKLWESLVWGWAVEGDMGGAGCVRKSTEGEEG